MIERIQYVPDHCHPNRPLKPIRCCVIHYISAIYVAPDRWSDPDTVFTMLVELNLTGAGRGRVIPKSTEGRWHASYHTVIARDGTAIHTLPRRLQAWHAGKSEYNGRGGCNQFSRGIAFIATHDSGYTDQQYATGIEICRREIDDGLGIFDVVGHEHVAPGRKKDPGPKFDWARLRAGLGG